MHIHVDFCLIPLGVGVSLAPFIAKCQKILEQREPSHQLHAYGTNIEGAWDEVFDAIKACHEAVHDAGAPRITSTIKVGSRVDRQQSLQDKIDSVQNQLT